MTVITTQIELDYMQAANQRVAADSQILQKRATLTLAAGSVTVGLPAEVVRLEALYQDTTPIDPIGVVEYMRLASGADAEIVESNARFALIGRTLYLWPGAPSSDTALTAIYSYRPATIDSGSTFELTGSAERLIERLVSSQVLIDDGQPELGQQELASYQVDLARLKRKTRRAEGGGRILRLAGKRRTIL